MNSNIFAGIMGHVFGGPRVIVSSMGTSKRVQFRFPRCKSWRINKKFKKREENFRIEYVSFKFRDPTKHKGVILADTPSGAQHLSTVSEPGLYRLIARSEKPQAEVFMDWVFDEVLPTIRKTGGYTIPQNDKRIFVKHDHSKTTTAPRGLDIRYTLDLGKIVANPTRRSVELLERLTGIQLTDIPLQEDGAVEAAASSVADFCKARCEYAENVQLPFAGVYAAYRRYCDAAGISPLLVASKKRFSSLMSASGYSTAKIGGAACYTDLRLVDREVTQ